MISKERLIKVSLIIMGLFFGFKCFDYFYQDTTNYLYEKILLLTILLTYINFIYPTL